MDVVGRELVIACISLSDAFAAILADSEEQRFMAVSRLGPHDRAVPSAERHSHRSTTSGPTAPLTAPRILRIPASSDPLLHFIRDSPLIHLLRDDTRVRVLVILLRDLG